MSTTNLQMPDSLLVEECTDTYGRFVLQPLERGYGVTIGNSFRRVLLSSLPGTAITAVKIAGVDHEYASLDGVSEDIYNIILNLKGVRFKQVEQSSGVINVQVKGPGTFTAGNINDATAEFEVLNTDHHIATLSEGSSIEIELRLSRGKGYLTSEETGAEEETDISVIPVDAIFTPIKSVKYNVENVRVGQRTDYEKLVRRRRSRF